MESRPTTVKDPVCLMEIDPKDAAGKTEYQGRTYYFCAPGCQLAFDQNPARYVSSR
jgi:YHS domain-containing protein